MSSKSAFSFLVWTSFVAVLNYPLFAQDVSKAAASVEIIRASEAEYISVGESEENVFILRGGILARSGKKYLRAETIKINTKTGEIFGEGQVSFEETGRSISGEKFYFDNESGSGIVYGAHSKAEPFIFSGQVIKHIAEQKYIARDAFFTTCEEKYPHYYFKAKKLWLYKNNEIAALHAIFYVGKTPIFYWPFLFQSDTGTGIVTQYGHNDTKGHFLQNTWSFLNPARDNSAWTPSKGKLMFDWYEKAGLFFGTELNRTGNRFNYNFNVSVADFKARRTTTDSNGSTYITNQVLQSDGSYNETHYLWYKIKTDARGILQKSNEQDSITSAFVRFEYYKHRNFDLEFGTRYEPTNTIESLYRIRFAQNNLMTNVLNWETGINHDTKNTHYGFKVVRQLAWYQAAKDTESSYKPIYDLSPQLTFSTRFHLLKSQGNIFRGAVNSTQATSRFDRYYNAGEEIKSLFSNQGFNQTSFYFAFFPWLNFIPSAGYGLNYTISRQNDPTILREVGRQSYHYLFTNNSLRIGLPVFYAQGTYIYRYGFLQGNEDYTFGREKAHAVNVSLISDLNPYAYLSISASRDLRTFPNPILEKERWSDVIGRLQGDYDFIRGFTANLYGLNQQKFRHFNGVGLINQAAYSVRFDSMNTNDFQFYYKLGGYKLPVFRELALFKIASTYRHNFINIAESNMTLGFESDILLSHHWRFRLGLNSRAEQFERYQVNNPAYVPFFEDAARSLNIFNPADQRNRVLNLSTFFTELEHDLHRWLLKVSFSINRRTIYTGSFLRDRYSFFEQTVYISFTLKDFAGFGLPHTELYRYNPTDQGIK